MRTPFLNASGPAVYDGKAGRWWTYAELRAMVGRLAEALERPSKALAFCFCRNDLATVAWYLAALEAGHAVALLDDSLAPEFRSRLIAHYAPDVILGSGGFDAEDYQELASPEPANRCWQRNRQAEGAIHPSLAVLLSTSGSTGSPKFVRLTLANLVSNARSICAGLDIGAEERAISSLPLHYSYGLSVLHTHLLAGGTMVLTDLGLLAPEFWKTVRALQCTSFAGVPYSYQILNRLGLESLDVPAIQTLTQAGGKLHVEMVARFQETMASRGGRFVVMYGQTEATARMAILPARCLPAKLGSAGLPIAGGRFQIEAGELVYSGPNVMMGYAASRDDLARGDELHGRLHTGDLAWLDEDGFLFVAGRMKRDAKIFGLRLNLDEIEGMLRVHGPTAVVGGADELLIFCEYGDEAVYARYRQELAARLKLHHRTFRFRHVPHLPLNANGKIDYQSLAEQA